MSECRLQETNTKCLTIALLAGDRDGGILIDGQRIRKALLEIDGQTLLEIALEKLAIFAPEAVVHVLANDSTHLSSHPRTAESLQRHSASLHEGQGSPIESLLAWHRQHRINGPILVATVDTPLLDPETLSTFLIEAWQVDGEVSAGVIEREVLWKRFPGMKRSFLRLTDGRFKGGNLFLLKTPEAWRVIEAWRHLEQLRKTPWALMRRLNWRIAARALLGRLSLSDLFAEASRILGARVVAIRLEDAALAADIDTAANWRAAKATLMRERLFAEGQPVTAVFDLDRTITRFGTYTPFLLFTAWRRDRRRLIGVAIVLGLMGLYRLGLVDRGRLKELMFELLVGAISQDELRPYVNAFVSFVIERGVRPGALATIDFEKRNGARLVMATAAPDIYADTIAERLGFSQVIATRLLIQDGIVHPRIADGNCYGERKLQRFDEGIFGPSYLVFYTDDASDLPMVGRVDQGFIVNPRRSFRRRAQQDGLPILEW